MLPNWAPYIWSNLQTQTYRIAVHIGPSWLWFWTELPINIENGEACSSIFWFLSWCDACDSMAILNLIFRVIRAYIGALLCRDMHLSSALQADHSTEFIVHSVFQIPWVWNLMPWISESTLYTTVHLPGGWEWCLWGLVACLIITPPPPGCFGRSLLFVVDGEVGLPSRSCTTRST